jgi:hypothetical protein
MPAKAVFLCVLFDLSRQIKTRKGRALPQPPIVYGNLFDRNRQFWETLFMKRDIQPVLAGMLSDPRQSDVVLV